MAQKEREKLTTAQLLASQKDEIMECWMKEQLASVASRPDLVNREELRAQSERCLTGFLAVIASENCEDIGTSAFRPVVQELQALSKSRAAMGFSPSETATFVFSLKAALLPFLSEALRADPGKLVEEVNSINQLLDKLGLMTFDAYTKGREEVISRQAADIYEMATPVIQVWDGVLAVPMIGTLDSRRTQVVMERLLEKIIAVRAQVAIIDITGVPMVDTLVAQHLLKTIAAVRLLGAECVITGISAPIAQTVVHLGVNLGGVITRASMADGLRWALGRLNARRAAERAEAGTV